MKLQIPQPTPITLDTDIDFMFTTPGILLKEGNQRLFNKVIISLRDKPTRKSAAINLDRIRCCIGDDFGYQPTDSTIWTSIRSRNIHRLTRNFLWKCMHNIYRIGQFWEHIPTLETVALCPTCRITESMEHIMLECQAPGQQQLWRLTEQLWRLRYHPWPKLNWGLLLGCNLSRFKSSKGKLIPAKNRFFAIIVSTAMQLIWNLRNERTFETNSLAFEAEVHNRSVSMINAALKRDCLLTNRNRFGPLALRKHLVLATWSGTLLNEDSLPDDWINSKRVLVGIRPITRKIGVG